MSRALRRALSSVVASGFSVALALHAAHLDDHLLRQRAAFCGGSQPMPIVVPVQAWAALVLALGAAISAHTPHRSAPLRPTLTVGWLVAAVFSVFVLACVTNDAATGKAHATSDIRARSPQAAAEFIQAHGRCLGGGPDSAS